MTSVMTDFPIINCPCLCSNIPESPAYGVFVSQLIRYAVQRIYSGVKDIEAGIFFMETADYISELLTNVTPLCHLCCTVTYMCDWFPVIWGKS